MDLIAEHNHKMKVFHDIVGCAMDVYNEYRHGLTEYPYQYGLTHLLDKLGYDVQKEYPLPLYLFGEKLKEHYHCDIVMVRKEGDIIIECKALKSIGDKERDQLRNYMLLTHCPYGILINFCKETNHLYSEAYHYVEDGHYVERYDTRYMGMMYEKTVKPWQSYLDEKRKTRSLYYHHITLKKK